MRPLLLVLLLCAPASAIWDDVGGSTLHYLRVGPGARALGMGEAYGPVATGAEAVYWNPGGLARARTADLAYSHAELLGLLRLEHVAAARPVPRLGGAVGLAATFFHQDSIPLVTNTNQQIGSFAPHGEAVSIAYARNFLIGDDHPARDRGFFQDLWRRPGAFEPLDHEPELWTGSLGLGAAAKFVSETIYDEDAWALALDLGAHFRPVTMPELTVSGVLRNLGTSARFRGAREPLPLEGAVGVAGELGGERGRLIPALEAVLPRHGKPHGKLGFEWSFPVHDFWRFALRAGYKSLTAPDLGPLSGLTGGIGLIGRRLSLDFAFQPMSVLGEVYRGSLGWRFDPPALVRSKPRAAPKRRSGKRAAPRKGAPAVEYEPIRY